MVLQYKQEFQNMNHEKPLLYHVFQLKFGQVYSAGRHISRFTANTSTSFRHWSVRRSIGDGKTGRKVDKVRAKEEAKRKKRKEKKEWEQEKLK
jgi:hypothetical protein